MDLRKKFTLTACLYDQYFLNSSDSFFYEGYTTKINSLGSHQAYPISWFFSPEDFVWGPSFNQCEKKQKCYSADGFWLFALQILLLSLRFQLRYCIKCKSAWSTVLSFLSDQMFFLKVITLFGSRPKYKNLRNWSILTKVIFICNSYLKFPLEFPLSIK